MGEIYLRKTLLHTWDGVTFDRKLTWSTQIQKAEMKATRRLSLMKKLAGANSRILINFYTGSVCPIMEYGLSA